MKIKRSWIRFFRTIVSSPTQRRHAVRWLRSLQSDYLLSTPSPWLTFDAIRYLKKRVRPGWHVFEYGSGGSTLYWLHLGADCVSIEHDPTWYSVVSGLMEGASGADYRLIVPEPLSKPPENCDPSDPNQYVSAKMPGFSFKKYASQIDTFPDQHFDLVIVDGRSRASCIMHSVNKVKVGGLLVLDNADRAYYLSKTRGLLHDFQQLEYEGVFPGGWYFNRTDIYVKQR
jgi:hypothetical protein